MNHTDVMKQALDALEAAESSCDNPMQVGTAICCIRAAIEEVEQAQPVAWMGRNNEDFSYRRSAYFTIPLYTHPQTTKDK